VGCATKLGLPISTTHAVIGAVVGFSFVETADGVIWWGTGKTGMGSIMLSWIVSPLFAGSVAACIYILTKKYCLEVYPLELAFERHKRLASLVTGWVTALIVLLVAYDLTETGTYVHMGEGCASAWACCCCIGVCTLGC
jgi:PiT family inorganic phosphate transporter